MEGMTTARAFGCSISHKSSSSSRPSLVLTVELQGQTCREQPKTKHATHGRGRSSPSTRRRRWHVRVSGGMFFGRGGRSVVGWRDTGAGHVGPCGLKARGLIRAKLAVDSVVAAGDEVDRSTLERISTA